MPPLDDETRYRLLKLLEAQPQLSQRELAREMGVSLGKANYCLRALVEKGLIKARNFKASRNKRAYAYFLTPKGAREKARVTARFLNRKVAEYQELKEEIRRLKREVSEQRDSKIDATVDTAGKEMQ